MSTRLLGLVLTALLAFYGLPASAHVAEEVHEDELLSTSTEEVIEAGEGNILDETEDIVKEEAKPRTFWGKIVQKLENKIEESVEVSGKARVESRGFFSKFGGFQKKVEGLFKRLNNDPS